MAGTGTGGRLAALGSAWVAGVALHLQQPALWSGASYASLLGAAVLLGGAAWLVARRRSGGSSGAERVVATPRHGWFVVGTLAVASAGFAASGWRATGVAGQTLAPALEGRDLGIDGVVASLPQRGPAGWRFRFDVDDASRAVDGRRLPARLSLGWYAGLHEDAAVASPLPELRAGQRWHITVRLRQPHGNLNPHGFDYELYLFERGLRATGYVRDAPPPRLLAEAAGAPVERLRQGVRDAIFATVADPRAAGVLAALAVGDQSAIARDDWNVFRHTGVAHLMAISGLHVTMFAWLAGLGVAALWRRSPRAMLWLAVPLAARWGGLAVAAGYAVMAGWGVPAQRTVWMLATVTLLQTGGLRWPWLLVLLAAAVVVTAIDPWALLQPGFWLSFSAVGLLMAAAPMTAIADGPPRQPEPVPPSPSLSPSGWRSWPRRLADGARGGLRTQVIATVGLTPLTLVFFQQVSLVGFAANLVAIPLVTLLVTPLAVLGMAVPMLWPLAAWVVGGLAAGLGALASLPGAVWTVPVAPLWAQAAGLLAAVLVVMPLPWRIRLLALPLALALLVPPRPVPPEGRFDLVAADVGQGTAVLLRTRGHVLVFDTGARYSRESDAGQRVLLPLLRTRGDEPVDLLMLSHRDSDHVGGAQALLDGLDVRRIASSLEAGHPLLEGRANAGRCEAGQRWTWDGVDFAVLHPPAADYERALKPNAMSCVLRVEGGGRSILLTGDIERAQEAALVDSGAPLRSDVLIAPHHGSRTSSSPAFLDAVAPATAVFQAGYRNRFGHPAAEVLDRYRARGIGLVTSPACGAWEWRHDGPAGGRCERERQRRYWHHDGHRGGPPGSPAEGPTAGR